MNGASAFAPVGLMDAIARILLVVDKGMNRLEPALSIVQAQIKEGPSASFRARSTEELGVRLPWELED